MSQLVENIHLEQWQEQVQNARDAARSIAPSLSEVRGRWDGLTVGLHRFVMQCFRSIDGAEAYRMMS